MTLPTFIVIGAAKAGTTALYWYLSEHPAVFMSPIKETNYFAYGVDDQGRLLYGDPDVHRFPVKTLEGYQRLFENAGTATAIGEASPIYLECPQAAGRIRKLVPNVRLIASLRHPVDRAYSDYQMYLRRRSRRFDPERDLTATSAWARPDSRWMQVGRYHEQLARYFEVFPREQIQVSLFDDLRRSPVAVTGGVYRFLGIDHGFEPDFSTPHAAGGMPANRFLEAFLTKGAFRSVIAPLLPARTANWIRRMRARNMHQPPPLPADLRKQLTEPLREDIMMTAKLIGRSLDHWL